MRFPTPLLGATLALTLTAGAVSTVMRHDAEVTSEPIAASTVILPDLVDDQALIRSARRAAEARTQAAAEQAAAARVALRKRNALDQSRRNRERASRSRVVQFRGESGTAPSSGVWYRLAQCESTGRWHLNTGSFDGGLQFLPSTWRAYGGGAYAPYAWQATPSQQITIATKVQAADGWGAWPACARKLGLL